MADAARGAEERIAGLLRTWQESPSPRVGLQLAEEYRRSGRHGDARAVVLAHERDAVAVGGRGRAVDPDGTREGLGAGDPPGDTPGVRAVTDRRPFDSAVRTFAADADAGHGLAEDTGPLAGVGAVHPVAEVRDVVGGATEIRRRVHRGPFVVWTYGAPGERQHRDARKRGQDAPTMQSLRDGGIGQQSHGFSTGRSSHGTRVT